MSHVLGRVEGSTQTADGGQQSQQNGSADVLVLAVVRTQIAAGRGAETPVIRGSAGKTENRHKVSLRERTEQRVELFRSQRVSSRKLLQQDQVLERDRQTDRQVGGAEADGSWDLCTPTPTPTMRRWRGLLKSTCRSSCSSLRCTSCGWNSRPGTGWTDAHAHRKSKMARRARSCWDRRSSESRLLAPAGRTRHGPAGLTPHSGMRDISDSCTPGPHALLLLSVPPDPLDPEWRPLPSSKRSTSSL